MSLGLTTATLNFENLIEIGQEGRNSQVYKAHDIQLDATLVVKKIKKTSFVDVGEFYKEAKRLHESEHQHVVPIKYACEDGDHIYLAMPFYAKGSLKKLIDARFLTVREILRYSIQFLTGLHHIHVKRLVHFDIKPDNILLSDFDEAMVSDFGLANPMNVHGIAEQDKFYMLHMPPESYAINQHSHLYDVYAAGLTIYRMCNGNNHFERQFHGMSQADLERAVLKGDFPNRKSFLPHIPDSLRKAIKKSLKVDPAERQQTVLQLLNELSVIDKYLDWQYAPNATGATWTLDTETKIIVISATNSGTDVAIETTKTMKESGRTTKEKSGCLTVSLAKFADSFQEILESYEG